jgi:hypothetical protein
MRNGFDKIVDEEEDDEEKNKKLWSEIVEACDGEAASVVRDAEEGDGLEAYEKLKERFQSVTATKTAAMFQGVLEYKQGEVKVAKHVTNWKDLLPAAKTAGGGQGYEVNEHNDLCTVFAEPQHAHGKLLHLHENAGEDGSEQSISRRH